MKGSGLCDSDYGTPNGREKRSLNGRLKIRPPLSASIYLCTSNLYTLYVLALTVDQGKLDSIGDDLA